MSAAFIPNMTSRREGISVLTDGHRRSWNGVLVELWEAEGAVGARAEYISEHPRLFVLLDQTGGEFELLLSPGHAQVPKRHAPRQISFIPAGMPLWSRFTSTTYLRHLDLHFDAEALRTRLADEVSREAFETPRLMFTDDRLMTFANMIAAECQTPLAFHELYGDSLTTAFFIDFLRSSPRAGRKRSALASWQLRRVIDYIDAHCADAIRLEELAQLVGLSSSYFSHAFKAATGVPPHQWQTDARLKRAQRLLLDTGMSLTEVAVATGFCDQAHFTRVFRQNLGAPPAAWRRDRRG
ncbi:HTH-type transcriptional activator RhaS [Starkeya nomas]|uniref:HTH-type transcriptional activator RhaS n=2 Tax=Xanthobacteraceae TaxID=335928 RepID=A0A5S9NR20_9HYPH|nr:MULTISPECIES: AraC family transcriptional regulator [Xanthobacteraceae]CAA0092928.1 HTH-type transcriptional activator RhaS [Starkeya nomas]